MDLLTYAIGNGSLESTNYGYEIGKEVPKMSLIKKISKGVVKEKPCLFRFLDFKQKKKPFAFRF